MYCLKDLICMHLAWYSGQGPRFPVPDPDANYEGLAGGDIRDRLFVDEFFREPEPGEEDWRRDLSKPVWEHTEGVVVCRDRERFLRSLLTGQDRILKGNVLIETDLAEEGMFRHLLTGTDLYGCVRLITASDETYHLTQTFASEDAKAYCLMDLNDLQAEDRQTVAEFLNPDTAGRLFRCLCSVAAYLRLPDEVEQERSLEELVAEFNRIHSFYEPVPVQQVCTLLQLSGLAKLPRNHSMLTLLACWDAIWDRGSLFRGRLHQEPDFKACVRRVLPRKQKITVCL